MRWLPVAVLALGFVIGGYNEAGRSGGVFGLCVAASVLLAWWVGRRSGRAQAFAAAVARAEARATAVAASEARAAAQAAVVVNVGEGARATAARDLGGLDAVEWRSDTPALPVVEQDVIEQATAGLDLEERDVEALAAREVT